MEYPLIRSRRKTVGIYIRPDGSFEVRAPLRLSKARIDEFVRAKESWILEKSALVRERAEERCRQAQAMPQTLPLLGTEYPILPGSPARFEDGSFVLPGPGPLEVRAQAAAVCRALAKDTLPARVSYWVKQTGLSPASVRVGSARTSWGCCSGKNAITLSWRLITASPPASTMSLSTSCATLPNTTTLRASGRASPLFSLTGRSAARSSPSSRRS